MGSLFGSAPSALLGVLGGSEGGEGGVGGSPGSLLEVWGSVLDDFLDVWIFGIHPQNNQDKENIVYITSKITRALRIRHFQIICYQNERVKNLILNHLNYIFERLLRPPGQGGKCNYQILLVLSATNDPDASDK